MGIDAREPSTLRPGSVSSCIGSIFCSLGFMGCTSFADVRSAEVMPGGQLDVGVTMSTPAGDAASWFWSYDCASDCDRAIFSPNVAFRYGRVPEARGRPWELGAGTSGTFPYATGYLQLARGPRPFGVGARVGVPVGSWREDAVFARYDLSSGSTRFVLTPTIFLHSGNSPNGQQPGWFLALAPAFGVQHSFSGVSATGSLTPVVGRTRRGSLNFGLRERWVTGNVAFLVAGVSLGFFGGR